MKNTQTSTLLNRTYTFNILDSIETEIEITKNPYHLPIDKLFTMAARINKKRSFLFVSKVLGKHLPIDAKKGLLTGALLAARYMEETENNSFAQTESILSAFLSDHPGFNTNAFIPEHKNPIIIGFAETATALGHVFFDCFKNADYFHTTREELQEQNPVITFEEEHSHATAHRCYIPEDMINNSREIILVDDEITTGKTALNIIKSIHSSFPREIYTVVSILDWRSMENIQAFKFLEKKLGVTIRVVSLIAGNVSIKQLKTLQEKGEMELPIHKEASIEILSLSEFFATASYTAFPSYHRPYIEETGRFGLTSDANISVHQKIKKAAAFLKEKRVGRKTLCLGTGEFMYIPMKIAAELGSQISYQSTTRSPIFVENKAGYGARYGVVFPNPEEQTILNFVYNIIPGQYDEIFIFFERKQDIENIAPLIKELKKLQIQSIKLVFFSGSEM